MNVTRAQGESMTMTMAIDRQAARTTIAQTGDLDLPFLTEAARQLDQAGVGPDCDLVFDLGRVPNAPSIFAGLALGSFWVDHRERFRGRIAIVAPPVLHSRRGLAVMEAAAMLAAMPLRVFDNQASCDQWLTAPVAPPTARAPRNRKRRDPSAAGPATPG